jgi:hypothetical protein
MGLASVDKEHVVAESGTWVDDEILLRVLIDDSVGDRSRLIEP